MKTKAQIIQELLEKKAITIEEAMVLLQSDVQYIPYQVLPANPNWPTLLQPAWPLYNPTWM